MIKLNIGDDGSDIALVDKGYISINDEEITQDVVDTFVNTIWDDEGNQEFIPKYNVEELKNQGKILQINVDKEKLSFPDGSVDIIVSFCCIGRGYIENYEDIVRVLNPNGKMYLYCSYLDELPKLLVHFEKATVIPQNFDFLDPNGEDNDYFFLLENPIKETTYKNNIPTPP